MKIRPVGAEFFFSNADGRANRQTNMTNLIVAFSHFCGHIRKALHHFTSRLIEVLRTELT